MEDYETNKNKNNKYGEKKILIEDNWDVENDEGLKRLDTHITFKSTFDAIKSLYGDQATGKLPENFFDEYPEILDSSYSSEIGKEYAKYLIKNE